MVPRLLLVLGILYVTPGISLRQVESFGFSHPCRPSPSLPRQLSRTLSISRKPSFSATNSLCNRNRNVPNHRSTAIRTIATRSSTRTALHSLVSPEDSWGNLATLSAVGVLAQNLGTCTRIGRLLGAPVTAMALTFLLASVGVLSPGGTPTSRSLQGLAIQYATPWILLGADFGSSKPKQKDKTLLEQTPIAGSESSSSASTIPLVFGFCLASLASLAGGWAGWKLMGQSLTASSLGFHDGLAIASALLAKNIGGGINYVAVCAALSASPEAIATGLCIDNIGALVYFPISNLLASRYPDPMQEQKQQKKQTETSLNSGSASANEKITETTASIAEAPKMTAESISFAFFSASTLLWLGNILAVKVLQSPSAQIPVVTLLAVLLAGIVGPNLPFKLTKWLPRGLKPTCDILGTVCLYLFFTTAGAPGIKVASSMKSALWPLSVFSVCLYAIHGGILATLYQLGSNQSSLCKQWTKRQWLRNGETRINESGNENDSTPPSSSSWSWRDIFSPQRLLVASSSAIGGPPTSVALARTVGWDSLVVPALLVGNIGYAISTFVGIAFYYGFK